MTLVEILKTCDFNDNHIQALKAQGYDDMDGFSTLSKDDVLRITATGGIPPVLEGKAASALRKVTTALTTALTTAAPVTPPALGTPVPGTPPAQGTSVPGTPPAWGGVPNPLGGTQRIMMVSPYDGSFADVLALLVANPSDDHALQKVTEMSTCPKTGQPRETFILNGQVIDVAESAALNVLLTRTGQVALKGLYKNKKARTLSKALRVRMQADPRDEKVMLVDGISTLDGVDWSRAWKNAHILTYARLFLPQQAKALLDMDGYTLASELETATHPRYAAVIADMQVSEEDDQTKLAQARQALIFQEEDSEVAQTGRATFPEDTDSARRRHSGGGTR